jgi:hypothetical protein
LLPEPKVPGAKFKVLNGEGYDDGGVGDLTMLIDLEDYILRRKRGDPAYFTAVKADVLPRVTTGQMAGMMRRDQKVQLATLLFSDGDVRMEDDEDNTTPSEVYMDTSEQDDEQLKTRRAERLRTSKQALRFSQYLCEPACASMSLVEISKRTLLLEGKAGAEVALRCAEKALEIASDQYYDNDLIMMEVRLLNVDDWPRVFAHNMRYLLAGRRESRRQEQVREECYFARSGSTHQSQVLPETIGGAL